MSPLAHEPLSTSSWPESTDSVAELRWSVAQDLKASPDEIVLLDTYIVSSASRSAMLLFQELIRSVSSNCSKVHQTIAVAVQTPSLNPLV